MIASFDRPEVGVRALPEAVIDEAVREYVENGVEAAVQLVGEEARPVFDLLETVSTKLQTNNEMDSLVRALRGEFIEPGPGADIIQNPDILPTGRNTHAINPYGVPSAAAFARSEAVANSLLDRYKKENGRYPEAMALVLWGLDNIKTQGEGVAQALVVTRRAPGSRCFKSDDERRSDSVGGARQAANRCRDDCVRYFSRSVQSDCAIAGQSSSIGRAASMSHSIRITSASTFCSRSNRMRATRTMPRFAFSQMRPAITAQT